jgi:hypothetical protein
MLTGFMNFPSKTKFRARDDFLWHSPENSRKTAQTGAYQGLALKIKGDNAAEKCHVQSSSIRSIIKLAHSLFPGFLFVGLRMILKPVRPKRP